MKVMNNLFKMTLNKMALKIIIIINKELKLTIEIIDQLQQ